MSTHNMFLWRNKIFILIPFNLELHKLWHFYHIIWEMKNLIIKCINSLHAE